MLGDGGFEEGLSVFHQRLDAHFVSLRARRDAEVGSEVPVFALEHGLTDTELVALRSTVRASVARGHIPRAAWLPFVIYAAEVGYNYAGDEYWQTFEAETPGWVRFANRDYVRWSVSKFADAYGGVRPSGLWASHRTIICWPITNAVLPIDLQRQLALLLYEYRTALTADLLADPPGLGVRLARRSTWYSSRFQSFAENTTLLGQVAAAMYAPPDEDSPYLLHSTLKRITESVVAQKEARIWLRDAQSTASRVRTHGFRPSPSLTERNGNGVERERLPSPSDPALTLQLIDGSWTPLLHLPDLSTLAERFPELHEQLVRRRVRVTGFIGAPLARNRLLLPGQTLRLDEWPDRRLPLFQLEGDGADLANRLLADQCFFAAGPVWLFRVRTAGNASEVRGKFVHPGDEYVMVVRVQLDGALPDWLTEVPITSEGAYAYRIRVPEVVDEQDVEVLRNFGIAVISDVRIRPAGVVPGAWAGAGFAEWLAGDSVVLAIESAVAVDKCVVTVDGTPTFVDWPSEGGAIFIGLDNCPVGTHDIAVALLPAEVDGAVAEGSFCVVVRPPRPGAAGGTERQGLMLYASPAFPSLDEIWSGRASIELLGPSGASVAITAELQRLRGGTVAQSQFEVTTPMDSNSWLVIAAKEFQNHRLSNSYDEADRLLLTAVHPDLGVARLVCEREFTPLRWVSGTAHDVSFARLVNNVDGASASLTLRSFEDPGTSIPIVYLADEQVRHEGGGLLIAAVAEHRAAVVLPPEVHDLADLRVRSLVAPVSRTVNAVVELIGIASEWATATLPGHPFAHHARREVMRALTVRIVSTVAEGRWAQLEQRSARTDEHSFQELRSTVGPDGYQRALAEAIVRRIRTWEALEPSKRAVEFAAVLALHAHRTLVHRSDARFAEFLLRLASEPATVVQAANNLRDDVERVMVSPVLLRLARFVVLAFHLDEESDTGSTYRGWTWT